VVLNRSSAADSAPRDVRTDSRRERNLREGNALVHDAGELASGVAELLFGRRPNRLLFGVRSPFGVAASVRGAREGQSPRVA
jgi:hypothetical protein